MSYDYNLLVNKLCPKAWVTIVDIFDVTKIIYEQLNQAIIDQNQLEKSLNLK
ncbi:hypothetical protein [Microcoleus sp. F4-D5]|uniref:hypothetical protein n=1 Tax=Microcoleus sp. F4-D5 TaxID=2818760 RepID=UPI002FD158C0